MNDNITRAYRYHQVLSGVLFGAVASSHLLTLPVAVAVAPVLVTMGVEVGAAAATQRMIAALRRSDRGELLLTTGHRIPRQTLITLHRWQRLEHLVTVGLGAYTAAAAPLTGQWLALLSLVPLALLFALAHNQAKARSLWSALLALQDRQYDRVLELVRSLSSAGPGFARSVRACEASARLALGQLHEAVQLFEQNWTGNLDASAVMPAHYRLTRGDPGLAERWLAAEHPDDRYHRYLRASLAGARALHLHRHTEVLDVVTPALDEVPTRYAKELALLQAAALTGLGRIEEARAVLQPFPEVAAERWRQVWSPGVWSLVAEALDQPLDTQRVALPPAQPLVARPPARPPSARPPALNAFEGPSASARPPAPRRSLHVGPLPAEWVPLTRRRALPLDLIVGLLGVTLLLLCLALAPLVLLLGALSSLDSTELALFSGVLVVGPLVASLLLATILYRWLPPGGIGLRMGDGWTLSRRWAAFRVRTAPLQLPLFAALPALALAVEVVALGSVRVTPFVVLLILPALLGIHIGNQCWRLVWMVHFADPTSLQRAVHTGPSPWNPHRGALLAWTALGRLVLGRVAEAEAALQESAALHPGASDLLGWIAAGRGEVDLQWLLRREEPEAEGPRFRRAVTLALAALTAGQAEQVVDRVPRWTELACRVPNRFGGLLHRANLAVLHAARHEEDAAAYRTRHAQALRDGAWAAAAWPCLDPPASP